MENDLWEVVEGVREREILSDFAETSNGHGVVVVEMVEAIVVAVMFVVVVVSWKTSEMT